MKQYFDDITNSVYTKENKFLRGLKNVVFELKEMIKLIYRLSFYSIYCIATIPFESLKDKQNEKQRLKK